MENRRFILIALLGVVLFFLYQAWQKDYGNRPPSAPVADEAQAPSAPAAATAATATATEATGDALPGAPAQRIRVETDVYIAEIATLGGELRRLELKQYPAAKDKPEPMSLLDDRNGRLFVLQSGLAGTEHAYVTDKTPFSAAQSEYKLADGQNTLDVTLSYTSADGIEATKTYHFSRDSYQITLSQTLKNNGANALTVSPYTRVVRTDFKPDGEPRFAHTFLGVGFYQQAEAGSANYKFKKTALDKLAKDGFETQQTGGWITMLQHYFVAAIVPPKDEQVTYSARPREAGGYRAQAIGAGVAVAPGAEQRFDTLLYIGPKLQDRIDDVAPGFELTLDYGILKVIARPMFWVLKLFHTWTSNWGVAIILLTVTVKLLLFKLSEAQYRSMAKMKVFGPKIQDIRERYADDRERQQKAMMDLYKKEGFNPLAGCWPILVQFPIFISLYWVLLESVELRQAPFMLWLQDLSAPDPFYVLPVIYGITMFLQQRMSGNTTMDPTQQKVMQVMPIGMTAFFAFFQSGLVLYWAVNGLISIAQQWVITRRLAKEGLKR
ncbi:membrane protein insertase YidC [Solimonas soli]|uniref:membrane protein insertase YidC n=1 Tax=Solimonas soli TaxID=413479 RepID=UPI000481BBD5|nr:membrane protein insertase YidC [Solimonas soli]